MAKLLTLVVAAVLLAATVANASTYTVTTTVEENGVMINQQGQECKKEMQEHSQQLRYCEQYLSGQTMGGGGRQYFARAIMNQMREQMEPFSGCCQALHNIGDKGCVCESLEKIASGCSSGRGQSAQLVMSSASFLPMLCGVGLPCQFESSNGAV